MKRRRTVVGAVVALGTLLVAITLLLIGAKEEPPYQQPKGTIAVLWCSEGSGAHYIPQPNNPVVGNFFAAFPSKVYTVDLRSHREPIGQPDVIWIHPSAITLLNADTLNELQQQMKKGVPLVYMDKNAKSFLDKLGFSGTNFAEGEGNTAIVGIAVRQKASGGQHFMVISAPNDRLSTEGVIPALNALVGGSNLMLESTF